MGGHEIGIFLQKFSQDKLIFVAMNMAGSPFSSFDAIRFFYVHYAVRVTI